MNNVRVVVDACCWIPDANKKGRFGKGKCACGVLIIDEYGNEHELSEYLGEMTVPEAEFNGLLFALDRAVEFTRGHIEVLMDSELVVKWMNGDYRMKKDHIKPLYDRAKALEKRYGSVKYHHHGRDTILAKRADKIAQTEFAKYK